MIASFSKNFIFVKTRKVGGTSLEIVLSSWCRDNDICSPVPPEDERIRHAFGGQARNFESQEGEVRFFNHMPASDIARELPELWNKSFKFTVERHPYEKAISRAWWNLGRKGGLRRLDVFGLTHKRAFKKEIDDVIERQTYLNFPLYSVNGQVLVDEIWPYEQMWDRLGSLGALLGMPVPPSIPRAKGGYRKDRRPARVILTPAQRDRIYTDARLEFDLLGFRP